MRVLVRWLTREDQGQDLVEWALLVAFIAIGSAALMNTPGNSVSGIWSSANQALLAQPKSSQTNQSGTGGTGGGNGGSHGHGQGSGGSGGSGGGHHHHGH